MQRDGCTYKLTAVAIACTKPMWAQVRQNSTIEMLIGHTQMVELLLAAGSGKGSFL